MKIRIIKLTPELLMDMLHGKVASFSSNLPNDAELLDLKLDLFSKQVLAVVRSESFEDVAECYPIPEFNLTKAGEAKAAPKPIATVKIESKPTSAPSNVKMLHPSKTTTRMENEFSPSNANYSVLPLRVMWLLLSRFSFLRRSGMTSMRLCVVWAVNG